MITNIDKERIENYIADEIIAISDSWYGALFITGKQGYYVVNDNDDDVDNATVKIEKFNSYESFKNGDKGKTIIVNKKHIDNSDYVLPSSDLLENVYGLKPIQIEFGNKVSERFYLLKMESSEYMYIDFGKGMFIMKSMHSIAEDIMSWCIKKFEKPIIFSTSYGSQFTGVKIFNHEGKEMIEEINNSRSYYAEFEACEKFFKQYLTK